jgi:hypothetical protein
VGQCRTASLVLSVMSVCICAAAQMEDKLLMALWHEQNNDCKRTWNSEISKRHAQAASSAKLRMKGEHGGVGAVTTERREWPAIAYN